MVRLGSIINARLRILILSNILFVSGKDDHVTTLQQLLNMAEEQGKVPESFIEKVLEVERAGRREMEHSRSAAGQDAETLQMLMKQQGHETSYPGRKPFRFPGSQLSSSQSREIFIPSSAPVGSVDLTSALDVEDNQPQQDPLLVNQFEAEPRIINQPTESQPQYDLEAFLFAEYGDITGEADKDIRETVEDTVTSADPAFIRLARDSKLYASPGENFWIDIDIESNSETVQGYKIAVFDQGTTDQTRRRSNRDLVVGRMLFPGESSFLTSVRPDSVDLQPFSTATVRLQMHIPAQAIKGSKHLITITAIPSSSLFPGSDSTQVSSGNQPLSLFSPIQQQLDAEGPPIPKQALITSLNLQVTIYVRDEGNVLDTMVPHCTVEEDTWISVCSINTTICQNRVWEARFTFQDENLGLQSIEISDSGEFWERSAWKLGDLQPHWLEWRGTCCTPHLRLTSTNTAGGQVTCSAGRMELALSQSENQVGWTVLVSVVVILVFLLAAAAILIYVIRRKRKAQLEEMRQLPQPR